MTLTATTTPPVSGQRVPRNKFEFSLRFHMVCISQLLELSEFCRVAPISTPSSLPAPSLNQGPFPPPALPSFVSTTGLSATPSRPACPSRASSWSFARPRYRASRVARAFLVCMPSPLPRRSDCGCPSLFSTAISAFPICVDGSACASSFSRIAQCSHYITACTLAKSPNVTLYIEGFSHFVTSMTAPITSGWSDFAGWVFFSTGTAPPFHGAHTNRTWTLLTTNSPFLTHTFDSPEATQAVCLGRTTLAIGVHVDVNTSVLLKKLAKCELSALRSHFVSGIKEPVDCRHKGATLFPA